MEKTRVFDTYQTVVESCVVLTDRNKNIRFRLLDGKSMHFKAGQFVQIFVPIPGEEKPRRTSYSIASSPQYHDYFELCVTHVEGGKSSTFLHTLNVGDKVTVMGPLGKFTLPDPLDRDAVFIATGSGIAPFRGMINDLINRQYPGKIYLVYGNRYDGDILYKSEWDALAQAHPSFIPWFTLSRPEKWQGPKGYVQDQIEQCIPAVTAKHYFICGLSNMINAVTSKLQSLGVPAAQIHFEKYD
jgi:ferredoxin-NADP reductase